MNSGTLELLLNLLLIAGGALTLYSVYFCIVAVFGFKKSKAAPTALPTARFAVLVAARNEQPVIGQLVDSLLAQNYPRELFDVYVAPNNCTDNTEAVARNHGARIFTPTGPISGKGQVLSQFVEQQLLPSGYDAMCVFDADNLVHPDFLQKMNDAYVSGAQVAQGFRDSKNPTDSAVSTCYSVCYWMVNRFYNGGRSALGLSCLVNGSGFMAGSALLARLGGWNTHTMTEDYEFSAQCVMAGEKVRYVPGAVIYDEQPLTFVQSWKQRRRWSTGSVQSMTAYFGPLMKAGFTQKRFSCIDMAVTFFTPMLQLISLVLGTATALLGAYQILELNLIPLTQVLATLAAVAGAAFLLITLFAAFMVWLNRRGLKGTLKGALYFAWFLLSWLPIGIISLFKKQKTWDAIAHTRSVSLADVA